MTLVQRRVIIDHVVIGHVNVPQVLWLTVCSRVFGEWEHTLPVLIWPMITGSIRRQELKTAQAYESS